MPDRPKPVYAVVRTWATKKRKYQIAVGPYPTRAKARARINSFVERYGYWNQRDEFTIAVFRSPEDVDGTGE